MSRNAKIIIAILFGVLVLVVVLGFFIFMPRYAKNPEISGNAASTIEKTTPKEVTILPSYKLYKNSEFGFEIQHPETWAVSEENIENVRGENTKAFYFKTRRVSMLRALSLMHLL